MVKTTEVHRPRSSQHMSVSWDEMEDAAGPCATARLQFEVAECVETKTITTTTTTKRSYPPLFVREPRPLQSLDTKEYPLAMRPTPPELSKFTLDLDPGYLVLDDSPKGTSPSPSLRGASTRNSQPAGRRGKSIEYAPAKPDLDIDTPTPAKPPSRQLSRLSSGSQTRKSSRTATRNASPSLSASRKSSGSHPPNLSLAVSDKLRRAVSGPRRDASLFLRNAPSSYLATPDASEMATGSGDRPARPRSLHLDRHSQTLTESGTSQSQSASVYDVASPAGSDSHTIFSSTVATPPITDADAEPFADQDESPQQSIRAYQAPARPTINTVAAQDASLPSPRLSPTLAAAQLYSNQPDDELEEEEETTTTTPLPRQRARRDRSRRWLDDSLQMEEDEGSSGLLVAEDALVRQDRHFEDASQTQPSILSTRAMLESFDAMPTEMKSFMMYQLLRRCPRKTLHLVADVVNPALKCDFIKQLPPELCLHVLSFLDYRDLCRAAQVSKQWRNIVDTNETGWKELFDRDGYLLPPGELQQAITEGWGWQDPVGVEGWEQNLSLQSRMTSSEAELLRSSSRPEPTIRLRSSKRKRGLGSLANAERSKRRASTQELQKDDRELQQPGHKLHKSEGPNSAASAAALAVPDPQQGLPSLRKLHLFKSLYRRHHMIRQNWTSGKVKPSHVAFAAHPRHVITCLQFDEDKIITGSDDTLIHVYDTKTGKLRKKLEGHEGGVWALQYEGNMLVSGSTDRSVRVWDIEKGLCTQVFYGHTSTVRCLQILMPTDTGRVQDGKPVMEPPKPLIITGSRDSQLRVWRLPEAGSRRYIQTGPPANDAECPYFIRILSGHAHSVRAISAHGDTLVSGSYDSTVRVWRISTGEQLHVLHGHSQKVYSVVLDHKRNRCISGSMDSLVKIWDLDTGACLHTLEGHSLLVGLLDLRDERLVSAAADSTLRIWDPETGKCKSTLMAHTGAITCFQHDGRKVISGSEKTVKMWDIHTGECIQDLLTDLSGVWQVKFDGRRCVAAVQRDNLTYVEVSRIISPPLLADALPLCPCEVASNGTSPMYFRD